VEAACFCSHDGRCPELRQYCFLLFGGLNVVAGCAALARK
jgi:hypothetical protein